MDRSVSGLAFVLLLGSSIGLSSCGTRLGTPQPVMSEADAEANLAARLEQDEVVHKQLNELRDVFRKAQGILKDLAPILGNIPERISPDILAPLTNHLPMVFTALARAVVKTEVDGTWGVEAQIVAGASLGDLMQCPSPRARLTGRNVADQEDVVLYLSDCSGQNWDRLAKWVVHTDGGIDMTYWPLAAANLRPVEGSMQDSTSGFGGTCGLKVSATQRAVSIGCQLPPISGLPDHSLRFGALELRDLPNGTAVALALGVGPTGSVSVDLAPDRAPRVTYCKDGEGSCSDL